MTLYTAGETDKDVFIETYVTRRRSIIVVRARTAYKYVLPVRPLPLRINVRLDKREQVHYENKPLVDWTNGALPCTSGSISSSVGW